MDWEGGAAGQSWREAQQPLIMDEHSKKGKEMEKIPQNSPNPHRLYLALLPSSFFTSLFPPSAWKTKAKVRIFQFQRRHREGRTAGKCSQPHSQEENSNRKCSSLLQGHWGLEQDGFGMDLGTGNRISSLKSNHSLKIPFPSPKIQLFPETPNFNP